MAEWKHDFKTVMFRHVVIAYFRHYLRPPFCRTLRAVCGVYDCFAKLPHSLDKLSSNLVIHRLVYQYIYVPTLENSAYLSFFLRWFFLMCFCSSCALPYVIGLIFAVLVNFWRGGSWFASLWIHCQNSTSLQDKNAHKVVKHQNFDFDLSASTNYHGSLWLSRLCEFFWTLSYEISKLWESCMRPRLLLVNETLYKTKN